MTASRLLISLLATSAPALAVNQQFGLTAYGEPCTDTCKQRGFPYAWCHKKPSWNGTYLNRDYCSPEFGKTRYLQTCLDNCERREGKPFYWCHTRQTNRGDWDFCSPFPGDSCQWSTWGSWGGCSTSCGPGSRTRRRRIEGKDGRVGDCSGETEVAFQACNHRPCAGFGSECQWGQWSSWAACSVSCGPGGERRRYRLLTQTTLEGAQACQGENSQREVCPYYPCPQTENSETPRSRTSPSPYSQGVKRLLGEFEHPLHGVSGKVYLTPKQDKILIEDFTYDGRGPDAFFWVGSEGSPGARSSVVLPHPFKGKFYDYRDPEVPRLSASHQEDIVLSLPPQLSAYNIKWISVWCRKFSVDFGHVIIEEDNGHNFLLDSVVNNVINNITLVELPSFTSDTDTITTTPLLPRTTTEEDDETISNEIQDVTGDPELITVELPDLSQLAEQPRSIGGIKGKQRTVTYSLGNELSDLGGGEEEQKTKHKDHREDQAKDDQTFSVKLDKMMEEKKAAMKDEADLGFTVIRVESSVSQLAEAEADTEADNHQQEDVSGVTSAVRLEEDEQEEEAVSVATETETKTEVDTTTSELDSRSSTGTTTTSSTEVSGGFSVDKLIEVTLSNIDGVSRLSTINLSSATTPSTTITTTTTTTIATTTTTDLETTTPTAQTDKVTARKSTNRLSPFTKQTTESPFKRRPSFFKTPEQRTRNRISALFNRVTSPKTPTTTTDDKLFTDEFVTSTPKTRRFSIAPRFTTPSPGSDETNEQSGRISGQPSFSTISNSNKSTFRPKIVDLLNEIPRDESENAIDDKEDNIINLSTSSLSPHELFSLIPRVTEPPVTVKLGDFVIPISTLNPPRSPPVRTTPSSLRSGTTTRSGVSSRPRGTTVLDLEVTPGLTTTETSADSAPPRRPGLFARPPSKLFTRRPGLARSTTASTPLTTPKLRTRKLQERIRNIFSRRRSTTLRPPEDKTDPPQAEVEDSTDIGDNELTVSDKDSLNEGQNSIFGVEHGDNDDETRDTDLNDVNVDNDRRKLFESKFRRPTLPRRKFTPRPSLLRGRDPAPRTTARSESLPPFTTPRLTSETPEPAPVTTPKRMSEDERFQIFTDFMKKTENMTTLKDTEITTVSGVIEDGGGVTLQHDLAESPRSSQTAVSRNNIGRERKKENNNRFGVSRKWESGRVTPSLFESSSPTPVSIFHHSVTPVSIFHTSPTPVPIFRSTDATLEIDLDDFDSDYFVDEDPPARSSPAPARGSPAPARGSPAPARFLPTVSPVAVATTDSGYNPCDIRGSCGPNAKCNSVNNEPTCSCPSGFSGIPRNGAPDPQHGCVRTPVGCGAGNSSAGTGCDSGHSCVRDVCLQSCQTDTHCALGERCITETEAGQESKVCIKICFYDAHCLAGEYCEENVCRPGCRSDSNCPFGQICAAGPQRSIRECEEGCHFSNDCPIGQECRDGVCRDPCAGFEECGTNAICVPVNHLPTCKCPNGYKELNSPYDACVVASADLTLLECLEDSDCGRGQCRQGLCTAP